MAKGQKSKRKRPGRPSKIERRDLTKRLIEALEEGNAIEVACAYAPIAEATFYNWQNRAQAELDRVAENPARRSVRKAERPFVEFMEEVTRAQREAERKHVTVINRAGMRRKVRKRKLSKDPNSGKVTGVEVTEHWEEGDWRASAWWLERRRHGRYGQRQRLEHTGVQGGPPIETTARVHLYMPRNGREAPGHEEEDPAA